MQPKSALLRADHPLIDLVTRKFRSRFCPVLIHVGIWWPAESTVENADCFPLSVRLRGSSHPPPSAEGAPATWM